MKKSLLSYKIKERIWIGEDTYEDNEYIIGVDIDSWKKYDLGENNPFEIIFENDIIPSGYTDISSIENWHKYGNMVVNDYLVIKDQIKMIMNEVGWSGLTSEEKDLCIEYYSLPDFQQPVIYLMTEKGLSQFEATSYVIQWWHNHHGKLLEVCKERWYYVKLYVASYFNFSDGEELMDLTSQLIFNFIECGRFGIEYGDQRGGLLDFIISKHDFENQGLKEQGYILNYGTWEEVIGKMVDVLLHGIYDKKNNIF